MRIKLSRGLFAYVSAKDYARCTVGTKWYAWASCRRDGTLRTYYAVRNIRESDGRRTLQFMHRFLLNLTETKIQADHKDGDGLNNCRSNLRRANNVQNAQNRTRPDPRSTSGVMGVYRDRVNKKWVAEIIIFGKYKFLGRFTSLRDAKTARQKAEGERWQIQKRASSSK